MKAAEFHAAFRRLGEPTLAPLGFVYRDKSWHHTVPGLRQLSICPHCDKFGHGFSVRYLTVALWHLEVPSPANIEFLPCRNTCALAAIKISPLLLGPHLESDFDDAVWDCPDPLSFETRLQTHLPVYFGGDDLWVLADPEASPEANRASLLHALADDGITDLSESTALERVEEALGAVARFGLSWSEGMTVERAAPLIVARSETSHDLGIAYHAPQYAAAIRE